MGLFGKTPERDPKVLVNEWSRKIRTENSQLDRQIRSIQREEEKVKKSLKEAAKKGDHAICTILAKEILRAHKAINKIYTSKAHLSSVQMQMKNQLATLRVCGSLQKSTEVMQSMQRLIKIPEVAATMRELSKEMMRAGIIEEMLEETMDSMDPEEMEEEAQEEIDKVLWEITQGTLGKAPAAVTETPGAGAEALPATTIPAAAAAVQLDDEQADEEDSEELHEMQNRLRALRS